MLRYQDFVDTDQGERALEQLRKWQRGNTGAIILREHFAMSHLPNGKFRLAILIIYRLTDDPLEESDARKVRDAIRLLLRTPSDNPLVNHALWTLQRTEAYKELKGPDLEGK